MSRWTRILSRALPGAKTYFTAWRTLGRFRLPHFRPLQGLWARTPEVLADRPRPETAELNTSSEAYYEHPEKREFWLNRPFSHPESAGKHLERFGLLLSTLGIREGDRVLDFGCGTGWTSIMMARAGASVVAMDIAPAALDIAREAAKRQLGEAARGRLELRTYGGDGLDLDDDAFDFVVVYDAFHHFPNPMTILREFHRVLAPEGRFGFAEPGIGHAETEDSISEAAHGILEQDLDLEQFYRSAIAAGFQALELAIPALEPEILTLPMERMRSYLRGCSWLVPQDFLRKTILTGPIGVFRKGADAVTSLNPRSLAAAIVPAQSRIEVPAGQPFSVAVKVSNLAGTVWLREGRRGRGMVRLGAHLLTDADEVIAQDYGRASLPRDLRVRDTANLELSLVAPERAGRFIIRLDMVDEGICWFEQAGSPPADVELSVRDP